MKLWLFMAACVVLATVPAYFVWHRVYKDGVFGRIGLLGISFAACSFLWEWLVNGVQYDVLALNLMLVWAFTIFLVWHLFRWHRNVLRRQKHLHSIPHRRRADDAQVAPQ